MWIIDSRDNGEDSQPNLVREKGVYKILSHRDTSDSAVIIGPVLASIYLYRQSDQG